MSHIVEIQVECRDKAAIAAACRRLKLPQPIDGRHSMYSGNVQGLGIQLQGWRYPIVATADGKLAYDNYGGAWGEQRHLDTFLQAYAVEKTKIEARRKGYTCTESQRADGSIRLTINTGRKW